jgi:glyoxylase-like metal-dependent hydrolase (beta-lactamase superfamily II)
MQVLMNTGGVASTNCYLVADESAKQGVLFDAPDHTTAPLLDEAKKRGWDVIGLWLTHGHFDHLADHAVVTRAFPAAKLLMHPLDEPRLKDPRAMTTMFALSFTIPPRSADGYVNDGDRLAIGSLKVDVIHTPGHSPGHVMYHFPDQKLLIGGDLIIMGAVGRTDLPGSNERVLLNSIRRVMQLPDDTQLLAGHGNPSTLGEEREQNEFVRVAFK